MICRLLNIDVNNGPIMATNIADKIWFTSDCIYGIQYSITDEAKDISDYGVFSGLTSSLCIIEEYIEKYPHIR